MPEQAALLALLRLVATGCTRVGRDDWADLQNALMWTRRGRVTKKPPVTVQLLKTHCHCNTWSGLSL